MNVLTHEPSKLLNDFAALGVIMAAATTSQVAYTSVRGLRTTTHMKYKDWKILLWH